MLNVVAPPNEVKINPGQRLWHSGRALDSQPLDEGSNPAGLEPLAPGERKW